MMRIVQRDVRDGVCHRVLGQRRELDGRFHAATAPEVSRQAPRRARDLHELNPQPIPGRGIGGRPAWAALEAEPAAR